MVRTLGMTSWHLLKWMKSSKKEFLKEYPQVTKETLTHAIGEYKKTLITPNSDFDRFFCEF